MYGSVENEYRIRVDRHTETLVVILSFIRISSRIVSSKVSEQKVNPESLRPARNSTEIVTLVSEVGFEMSKSASSALPQGDNQDGASAITPEGLATMISELNLSVTSMFKELNGQMNDGIRKIESEITSFGAEMDRVKNQISQLQHMREFSAAINELQFSSNIVEQSSPVTPLQNRFLNTTVANELGEPSSRSTEQRNNGDSNRPARSDVLNTNNVAVLPDVDNVARVKLNPEIYDGSKRWSDYLLTFELTAEINNWDGALKAKYLAAMLRGPALEVYRSLPVIDRLSYSQLKLAMDRRFGEQFHQALHHAQLRARLQQKGEDLTSFADDIRRLVVSAYHDCTPDAQDKIAMNHFLDGLNDPSIQDLVRFGLPKTLNGALQSALQFQISRNATRTTFKPVRLVQDSATSAGSDSEDSSGNEEPVYGVRSASTQTQNRRRSKYRHQSKNSGNGRMPS